MLGYGYLWSFIMDRQGVSTFFP